MIGKPSFSEWVLKPNRNSKATFEVVGVRFIPYLVEARGIEPLSENSSSRPSPSADGLLSFPRAYASRQAHALGIP